MSGRDLVTLGRPLGATLALAGLLLAAAGAVGASWAGLSAAREERDAKADLLQRGAAASRRARAASDAAPASPFIAADSATLAAAALDADLRAWAVEAGLSVLSSRADAKAEDPGPLGEGIGTRIEEQAVVEGQNEAVQALLAKLDGGAPTVLVDALAMVPADAGEGAAADPGPPRLRASVTLSAYWRPGARPTAQHP